MNFLRVVGLAKGRRRSQEMHVNNESVAVFFSLVDGFLSLIAGAECTAGRPAEVVEVLGSPSPSAVPACKAGPA